MKTVESGVSLAAMIRRASKMAERVFVKNGEVELCFIFEVPGEPLHMIIVPLYASSPLEGHAVKNAFAAKLRETFAEKGVARYVFIAEAWAGTYNSDDPEAQAREYATAGYTFKDHPSRREIIHFEAVDGRELLTAEREIIRPVGRKAYLGKLSAIERPSNIQGRWLNLLPSSAAAS